MSPTWRDEHLEAGHRAELAAVHAVQQRQPLRHHPA
jgi:hypothetical protein